MSPGASLNCTRTSAFRDSKALPAFMMKGTPETSIQKKLHEAMKIHFVSAEDF
jgi:hypothetical protein